jgi:hypothetical protein
MTKSTNDLNCNSEREDVSTGEKNIISKNNLQFIEQIGEGKFSTGNLKMLRKIKLNL